MKKTIAIVLFVAAAAIFAGIFAGTKVITAVSRHTVESRIAVILKKKPHLKEAAKISGGKLRILIFKNERSVEVYDMRKGRKPELERSPLKWYPDLCREIDIALCGSV